MNQTRIPTDIIYNLLLELPYRDLLNYCQSNKQIYKVCSTEYFWENKYYHDFDNIEPNANINSWRLKYHNTYNNERLARDYLVNFLKTKYPLTVTTPTKKPNIIKVVNIAHPELYLIGIFLLPLNMATWYLNFYPYHNDLIDLPSYLIQVYEWFNGARNNLAKVPPGTSYGYRQVLIFMASINYKPEQAQQRLQELYLIDF